jgi:sensor domain CHASE-containing protein
VKLRWSILGVILLTFIGLVAILSISLQGILVPHFHDEEDRSARLNVQRMLGVLDNEQAALTEAVKNWASRDETYEYITSGSPDYIQTNLSDAILKGLNVDLLAFIDLQGKIIYVHTAGSADASSQGLPDSFQAHIQPGDILLRTAADREPRSGLLAVDGQPLLLVSAPVLKTSGEGPAAGTLLAGRTLDDTGAETSSKG